MKLVLNKRHGGFGLSEEAKKLYLQKKGIDSLDIENFCDWRINRQDKTLIKIVEELWDKANGEYAYLVVVEIPDGCYYKVRDYDGFEQVYFSDSPIFER